LHNVVNITGLANNSVIEPLKSSHFICRHT